MDEKTRKINKIIDYCIFFAMTACVAVVTFILFKNQAVHGIIYHESGLTIDRFHSDMYAYMQEMQGLDSGYSFPYPVFFKLSALFNLIFSPENSVALATCLLNTLAIVFTKFSFDHLFEDTFKDFSKKKYLIFRILTSLFAVSLFFVSMVVPPFNRFYIGTKFRYTGVFSPNPFQNATYMAARPFAIVSYVYFMNLLSEYEKDYKGKWRDYIVFAIAFLISTMTKPSFTLVLGAAAVVVILVRFFANKCKTVKESIFLGLLFLPTIIDLLYQFKGVFVPSTGEVGGVGFCLGDIWFQYTNNIVTSVVYAIAFPLVVLVLNIKRIKSDYKFRFAWLFYIISFCAAFFCYEKGRRAVDFNFSWSYMYGIFFLFFESVIVLTEDLADKKRKGFAIAEILAFLVHLASGIGFFLKVFSGETYY